VHSLKRIACVALLATFSGVAVWAVQADNNEKLQSLLAAAQQTAARKDFSAAADCYREAVGISPDTAELWADLGLMYHQAGNSAEAIKSFTEAARLNSRLFVPQLFLGIEYLGVNRTKSAIPYLEAAEKLNPTDPQAPLALGRAFAISGQGDRSSDAYWRAVTLAPGNGRAWLGLGTAYLQQVESDARTMTGDYKDSGYVKLRAGESFAEQDKLVQAAAAYKAAASASAPPPCAHAGYAIVLLRQEAIREAQAELELELNSNSDCALTHLGFAGLQSAQGKTEEALRGFLAIWNADPVFLRDSLPLLRHGISTEQSENLVRLATDREGAEGISSDFERLMRASLQSDELVPADFPGDWDKNPDGGSTASTQPSQDPATLYRSGQYGQCSQSMRRRLRVLPESSLLLLATCAYYAGDYRTASLVARRLAINSGTRPIGLYWGSKADQRLAVAALTRAGEIDAESPRMHVLLGDVYRQERSWGDAEEEYQKALVLEPEDRSARLGLAISLLDDAKLDAAYATSTSLLQKHPDDPEANLLTGEILVQRNLYDEAETYLNKSRDNKPEFLPRLHALLGEVYANTNRVPQAVSEFKLGLVSDEDGSIHYQLARLYQKTGNKSGAAEAFHASQLLRKQWDGRATLALQQPGTDISRQ
jgi:tetratricopeptide (TPR) repeat protein